MRNDIDENFTQVVEEADQTYLFTALEELGCVDFAVSGGAYLLNSSTTPPTESAIIAKVNEIKARHPMNKLRNKRNGLLNETDWVVTKYAEAGQSIPQEWVTYRQALRDITDQTPDNLRLTNIVWPTKPEV